MVPSNLVPIPENATLTRFALLTSAMHMAWLRHVGGRLESRYRYSIGLADNTIPKPTRGANNDKIEFLTRVVLDARAADPDATLTDPYDPDLMPPTLRRAHNALDSAVDRLHRGREFASVRERADHLFMLYEKMRAPPGIGVTKLKRRW